MSHLTAKEAFDYHIEAIKASLLLLDIPF